VGSDFFEEIGRAVESRWAAVARSPEEFPDVAGSVLEEAQPPADLSAVSILCDAIGRSRLDALGPDSFGQPPLTLYRGPDFYVSALVWMDGTTSIHEHAFAGAFRVLAGSSVHCEYRFDPGEAFDERLVLGDLVSRDPELLEVGATRRIASGPVFIHSLFHLEQPSVTLVVRTIAAGAAPQLDYALPGVAWDPIVRDDGLRRQLAAIRTLHHLAPGEAVLSAMELLSRADPWLTFVVVHHWLANIGPGLGLDWLLDHVAARHRTLGDAFRLAFEGLAHRYASVLLRRTITDPDERFALALEANVPDEASRAKLQAQRAAAAAPPDSH
jgi:hypothetical protein